MAIATDSSDDSSSTDRTNDHPSFTGVIDTETVDPILRHLTELYREYKVVVNEYGLHIKVIDGKNVAQIDVRIHREDFQEFHVDQQGVMGLSHKSLEDMRGFVDDGSMHLSVDAETRMMTVTDESERMFYDTALIDPDSIRDRKMDKEFEPETSVTVDGQMFAFKKFIRDNKGYKNAVFDVTEDNTIVKVLDRDNDVVDTFTFEDGGEPTEVSVSPDYLYNWVKRPLKSQLNGRSYTFTFHGNDHPVKISREMDDSKLEMTLAPRRNWRD